jgi:hypothetical protein
MSDLTRIDGRLDIKVTSLAELKAQVEDLPETSPLKLELVRILAPVVEQDINFDFLSNPLVERILQGQWHKMNRDYETIIQPKLERLQKKLTSYATLTHN